MTRIAEYYASANLYDPPRIEYREFAFVKNAQFIRHKAFFHISDVRRFCVLKEPEEVFYSTAYYQHPSIIPMSEKKEFWVGCDLVFDFDSTGTYSKTREESEYYSLKLLKFFQRAGAQEIMWVDSGMKGYHVHIQDWQVWNLTSAQRLEVIHFFRKKMEKGNPNYVVFDEDITFDITRLIRLPGSLYIRGDFNGKCMKLDVPGTSREREFDPGSVFKL